MKGRTYRYFEGEPLYPFGFGLSYTQFVYSKLKVQGLIKTGENLTVSVKVKNAGSVEGDEVVQLYIRHPEASVPTPLGSLEGFNRVHLKPGQTQVVTFSLNPKQLAVFSDNGNFTVEPGKLEFSVGGGIDGHCPPTSGTLTTQVRVNGHPYLISDK